MIFSIGSPHRPSLHTQTFLEHLQIKSPKGVRISEALLIEQLPNALSQKTLFLNSSDGLLPGCFALYSPETLAITPSTAFYYEATSHQKAQETLQRNHIQNVKLLLAPTPLPDEKESFDRIFLPLQHTHESELTREWLIHALRLLKVGGVLFVSIDSRKKQSLENLIHKYFTSIQLLPSSRRKGALWILRKKTKDKIPSLPSFRSYTAKDGETIARFCSQTGVFAHGRIDDGARALLKVVEVLPEDRILDLGCGAGEIGILSALRSPKTSLVLTDSNTRAIQVAQVNAESLLPHRFQTLLSPQIAETYSGAPFSLILTNPPYFSHYSISQAFLQAISKLLHPQGRFYLVTKQQEWHRQAIQKDFILVAEYQKLGYTIFLAQQKPSSSESTKDEVLRTP